VIFDKRSLNFDILLNSLYSFGFRPWFLPRGSHMWAETFMFETFGYFMKFKEKYHMPIF